MTLKVTEVFEPFVTSQPQKSVLFFPSYWFWRDSIVTRVVRFTFLNMINIILLLWLRHLASGWSGFLPAEDSLNGRSKSPPADFSFPSVWGGVSWAVLSGPLLAIKVKRASQGSVSGGPGVGQKCRLPQRLVWCPHWELFSTTFRSSAAVPLTRSRCRVLPTSSFSLFCNYAYACAWVLARLSTCRRYREVEKGSVVASVRPAQSPPVLYRCLVQKNR